MAALALFVLTGGIRFSTPAYYTGAVHLYAIGCLHYATALGQGPNGRTRTDAVISTIGADSDAAAFVVIGDFSEDSYHVSGNVYDALMDHLYSELDGLGGIVYKVVGNHEPTRYQNGSPPAGVPVNASHYVNDGTLYNEFANRCAGQFSPYVDADHTGRRWYGKRLIYKGQPLHAVLVVVNDNAEAVTAGGDTAYTDNNPDGYGQADDDLDGLFNWNSPMRVDIRRYVTATLGADDWLFVAAHRALTTGVDGITGYSTSARPALTSDEAWGASGLWAEMDSLSTGKIVILQADTHEDQWVTLSSGAGYVFQASVALRPHDNTYLAAIPGTVNFGAWTDSVISPTGATADSLGAACDSCADGSYTGFTFVNRFTLTGSTLSVDGLLWTNDSGPTVTESMDLTH